MNQEVQIEGDVRRQQQIEDVVGIKRQRVRSAGQRLPAAVREVPPRDLSGVERLRLKHLDRIERGEVVAEVEKAEVRQQEARRGQPDRE